MPTQVSLSSFAVTLLNTGTIPSLRLSVHCTTPLKNVKKCKIDRSEENFESMESIFVDFNNRRHDPFDFSKSGYCACQPTLIYMYLMTATDL